MRPRRSRPCRLPAARDVELLAFDLRELLLIAARRLDVNAARPSRSSSDDVAGAAHAAQRFPSDPFRGDRAGRAEQRNGVGLQAVDADRARCRCGPRAARSSPSRCTAPSTAQTRIFRFGRAR